MKKTIWSILLTLLLVATLWLVSCDNTGDPTDTTTTDTTDAATTDAATTEAATTDTEPCSHVEGDWILDAEASCTTDGARHTTCTLCGETVAKETIPAGHVESAWIVDRPAEIGVEGSRHIECTVCGATVANETIPALVPSEGLKFTSNGDGTCCVSDIGACIDIDIVIPLTSPEGWSVTSITEYAFSCCSNLRSIVILDSVTSIGYRAFEKCSGLTSVTIGNGVISIGESAFSGCSSLMSIEIPDSVTRIGESAFSGCSSLMSIEIPDSVTRIRESAFSGCSGLIQTQDGVRYVDKWVVGCDSSVSNATLREGTVGIADYAFFACSGLRSVDIPDSVTSIGYWAFESCSKLGQWENNVKYVGKWAVSGAFSATEVTLREGTVGIASSTFSYIDGYSKLTSIVIPDSLTSVSESAFSAPNLTNVYFTGTEEEWAAISIDSYNECLTNATIHYNYVPEA